MSMSDKPVMLIAGGTGSIGSEPRARRWSGLAVVLHGRSDVRLAAVLEGMQCSRSSIEGFAADAFAAAVRKNHRPGRQVLRPYRCRG